MTNERREWWILQAKDDVVTEAAYREENDIGSMWKSQCIHVREVLPGDDSSDLYIELLEHRHKTLRSAAGAALEHFDLEPPRGDKESHRVLVRLAAALESEAGDE